jgi:hypothetical protein
MAKVSAERWSVVIALQAALAAARTGFDDLYKEVTQAAHAAEERQQPEAQCFRQGQGALAPVAGAYTRTLTALTNAVAGMSQIEAGCEPQLSPEEQGPIPFSPSANEYINDIAKKVSAKAEDAQRPVSFKMWGGQDDAPVFVVQPGASAQMVINAFWANFWRGTGGRAQAENLCKQYQQVATDFPDQSKRLEHLGKMLQDVEEQVQLRVTTITVTREGWTVKV